MKKQFSATEDEYNLAVLRVASLGLRLGKSIEEILADVSQAPAHLKNPVQSNSGDLVE